MQKIPEVRNVGFLGVGIADACKPPNEGSGNQFKVLWKRRTYC